MTRDLQTLIDLKRLDTLEVWQWLSTVLSLLKDLLAKSPELGPCSPLVAWEHAVKRFYQARWRAISMPSTARILLDVSTPPCGVLEPVCREKGTKGKGSEEASPGICTTVLVNASLPACQYRTHSRWFTN